MQQLQKAYIPEEEIAAHREHLIKAWDDGAPDVRKAFPMKNRGDAVFAIAKLCAQEASEKQIWMNDTYQVAVTRQAPNGMPALTSLSIRRRDRQPIHDWRHLQEIKNQLLGEEAEAIELYPAESRKVDSANQFWLWHIEGVKYPFGFNERLVTETRIGKSVNRPFEKVTT